MARRCWTPERPCVAVQRRLGHRGTHVVAAATRVAAAGAAFLAIRGLLPSLARTLPPLERCCETPGAGFVGQAPPAQRCRAGHLGGARETGVRKDRNSGEAAAVLSAADQAVDGLGKGLPPPSLEGTRWKLSLDIGRTPFTLMPMTWASGGVRAKLEIAVEFRAGGNLAVLQAGEFLGEWAEPTEIPFIVELLPLLSVLIPEERVLLRPSLSAGRWWVAEDGRTVRFFVETSGFRREVLWVPKGKLYFRAQAYGQLLVTEKKAAVSIRESRSTVGAAVGAFIGSTMGPAALAVCGAAGAYALREVPITVGNYVASRMELGVGGDDGTSVALPPVRLVEDDKSKWQ
mmetsp:Transcript_25390/g.70666  ORF Transcript_25390/g.70666 Transcript_25390/m.70666 type:complete len:345 (+) Transcript_25390:101-1135(+)